MYRYTNGEGLYYTGQIALTNVLVLMISTVKLLILTLGDAIVTQIEEVSSCHFIREMLVI